MALSCKPCLQCYADLLTIDPSICSHGLIVSASVAAAQAKAAEPIEPS